jgi:hypothetical protein
MAATDARFISLGRRGIRIAPVDGRFRKKIAKDKYY